MLNLIKFVDVSYSVAAQSVVGTHLFLPVILWSLDWHLPGYLWIPVDYMT